MQVLRLVSRVTDGLLKDKFISSGEVEMVIYGLENIVNNLLGIMITLVVGFCFKCVMESIVLWLLLFSLRKNAGGFHAETKAGCLFSSTIMLAIEETLSTDFEEIGLTPEHTYIIVISGEDNNAGMRSTVGSSFNYTYNGKSYKMRYMTITAADDPLLGQASAADVLKSNSKTLIQNCLDTAISTYINSVSTTLGTVASICGLSVSQFGTAKSSTLTLNGGSNWTRVYTQVWSSYFNAWAYASEVEYVTAVSYMSGLYYSASKNQYVSVPANSKTKTTYSSCYFDTAWRKEAAAVAFEASQVVYNKVGAVKYRYGGSTKITHNEHF